MTKWNPDLEEGWTKTIEVPPIPVGPEWSGNMDVTKQWADAPATHDDLTAFISSSTGTLSFADNATKYGTVTGDAWAADPHGLAPSVTSGRVDATDDNGTVSSPEFTMTVEGKMPTVTIADPGPIAEGSTTPVIATVTNTDEVDGADGYWEVTDFGLLTTLTTTIQENQCTITPETVWDDPVTFNLTVKYRAYENNDLYMDSATRQLTVTDQVDPGIYVRNGGDDTGSGTNVDPFATLAQANSVASPGDTIYCDNASTWDDGGDSSSGHPILEALEGVTYDGASWGNGTRARLLATVDPQWDKFSALDIHKSNVTVTGFEVDGAKTNLWGVTVGYGIPSSTGGDIDNIVVRDCVVHDYGPDDAGDLNYGYGIHVGSKTEAPITTVSNVLIEDCEVYSCQREGIALYPAWDNGPDGRRFNQIDNVTVRRCYVHDCRSEGMGLLVCNLSTNCVIEHCTVANTDGGYGLWVRESISPGETAIGSPQNLVVRHNIIRNTAGIALMAGNNGTTPASGVFHDNLLIDNRLHAIFHSALANTTFDAVYEFYNNTIYDNGGGDALLKLCNDTAENCVPPDIRLYNNIMLAEGAGNRIMILDGRDSISDSSHNTYYSASSAGTYPTINRNGFSYSYNDIGVTWEAGTGETGDPGFVGGTLPSGFSGTPGSDVDPYIPNTGYFATPAGPGVDSGTTTAYTIPINTAGMETPKLRPQNGLFDRGAYELLTDSLWWSAIDPVVTTWATVTGAQIEIDLSGYVNDTTGPVTYAWVSGPGAVPPGGSLYVLDNSNLPQAGAQAVVVSADDGRGAIQTTFDATLTGKTPVVTITDPGGFEDGDNGTVTAEVTNTDEGIGAAPFWSWDTSEFTAGTTFSGEDTNELTVTNWQEVDSGSQLHARYRAYADNDNYTDTDSQAITIGEALPVWTTPIPNDANRRWDAAPYSIADLKVYVDGGSPPGDIIFENESHGSLNGSQWTAPDHIDPGTINVTIDARYNGGATGVTSAAFSVEVAGQAITSVTVPNSGDIDDGTNHTFVSTTTAGDDGGPLFYSWDAGSIANPVDLGAKDLAIEPCILPDNGEQVTVTVNKYSAANPTYVDTSSPATLSVISSDNRTPIPQTLAVNPELAGGGFSEPGNLNLPTGYYTYYLGYRNNTTASPVVSTEWSSSDGQGGDAWEWEMNPDDDQPFLGIGLTDLLGSHQVISGRTYRFTCLIKGSPKPPTFENYLIETNGAVDMTTNYLERGLLVDGEENEIGVEMTATSPNMNCSLRFGPGAFYKITGTYRLYRIMLELLP